MHLDSKRADREQELSIGIRQSSTQKTPFGGADWSLRLPVGKCSTRGGRLQTCKNRWEGERKAERFRERWRQRGRLRANLPLDVPSSQG